MTSEQYLKQFIPKQWLEATIRIYAESQIEIIPLEMIRLGFALAQPDGWKLVAPAWMEQFEVEGIIKLSEVSNDT